jgi:hypothetical protein
MDELRDMDNEREELIRRRAYAIWEQEGRPDGQHQRHWEQAAREMQGPERRETAPRRRARSRPTAAGGAKSRPRRGLGHPLRPKEIRRLARTVGGAERPSRRLEHFRAADETCR